jgi:hypothetical protein
MKVILFEKMQLIWQKFELKRLLCLHLFSRNSTVAIVNEAWWPKYGYCSLMSLRLAQLLTSTQAVMTVWLVLVNVTDSGALIICTAWLFAAAVVVVQPRESGLVKSFLLSLELEKVANEVLLSKHNFQILVVLYYIIL